MRTRILITGLAALLALGAFAEATPALARRGADDSFEKSDDRGRGRGRGQDDVLEDHQRREGRRGKHHLQGKDHRRDPEFEGGRNLKGQDDSPGPDGGRGRGGR